MSYVAKCLLVELLSRDRAVQSFSLKEWDLIIRQARATKLLGSLGAYIGEGNAGKAIPIKALNHIQSVSRQAGRTKISSQYEIEQIGKITEKLNYPVIVLKGAAYVLREYSSSIGRLFSDIDILVPKKQIYDLERRFLDNGWYGEKQHPYDQKYYRQWMHELPPLTNSRTGSTLDLHHNILPETASIKVNVDLMIVSIIPVDGFHNIYTLSPVDMVLHSLTHLFHEGEFDHGLRDLLDVHRLVISFCEEDDQFWMHLLKRSFQLSLSLPLLYGVRYLILFLKTDIPSFVVEELQAKYGSEHKVMDFLFVRALMPNHKSCDDKFSGFARWCLYVRSHHLRMPAYLLIPHLLRKAYMKRKERNESTSEIDVDGKNGN